MGTLLASSGSDPKVASTTSGTPSPSLSAVERGSTTVKRFAGVNAALELPDAFVPTSANVPACAGLVVRLMLAEAPKASMAGGDKLMAGGVSDGAKAKVAPLKLKPAAVKLGTVVFSSADLRLSLVITGAGMT